MAQNQQANIHFSMEKGTKIMNKYRSAVKRVEFVSDRMTYIILRGRWCDVIVLNVHAPTVDKIDDMKNMFYEELERVFLKGRYFQTNNWE
jgi:hypothetical protein